jgi:hypothetical protein
MGQRSTHWGWRDEWLDAEAMSVILAQTSVEFPGQYSLMLLDGVGWHRAVALLVPSASVCSPLPLIVRN